MGIKNRPRSVYSSSNARIPYRRLRTEQGREEMRNDSFLGMTLYILGDMEMGDCAGRTRVLVHCQCAQGARPEPQSGHDKDRWGFRFQSCLLPGPRNFPTRSGGGQTSDSDQRPSPLSRDVSRHRVLVGEADRCFRSTIRERMSEHHQGVMSSKFSRPQRTVVRYFHAWG